MARKLTLKAAVWFAKVNLSFPKPASQNASQKGGEFSICALRGPVFEQAVSSGAKGLQCPGTKSQIGNSGYSDFMSEVEE
jgi:hypothetical protein